MKESKSELFSLSYLQNSSKHISLEKMKNSKKLQNKTNIINVKNVKCEKRKQKSNSKEKNKKISKKFIDLHIINSQLQKHNSNPLKKSIMIINDIIDTKTNHYLAVFKDYLISDYIDEFLKRFFNKKECLELIPKFYIYYQNYLKFFCRGFFIDYKANSIIQEYGECQAELYYNKNYGGKNKKGKKMKNEENINKDNSSQNSSNCDNNSNTNQVKKIFTETLKNSLNKIENNKLMQYYIEKYNKNELSNILYKSKNETITLNDDTKVYNSDNIITNENSIINLIDMMIKNKREKKKINKNKSNKKKKI